jgi:hypothetical protein
MAGNVPITERTRQSHREQLAHEMTRSGSITSEPESGFVDATSPRGRKGRAVERGESLASTPSMGQI